MNAVRNTLLELLAKLSRLFVENDPSFRIVVAPGLDSGPAFGAFLEKRFVERQQHYMLDDRLKELELTSGILTRSSHFMVYKSEEMIATLRATRCPFELAIVSDILARETVSFRDYVEFSRLLSSDGSRTAWVGPALLADACRWSIEQGFAGIIAVTRRSQKRLFERFGLKARFEAPVKLKDRGEGEYWLMTGDWSAIYNAVVRMNFSPGRSIPTPLLPENLDGATTGSLARSAPVLQDFQFIAATTSN